MQASHGGKAKNDKIDAHKSALWLRGGMMPHAYVYPAELRATRELLYRRCHLVQKRGELFAHIQNTNSQENLTAIGKKLTYKATRAGVAEHVPAPSIRKTIEMDVSLMDHYDQLLGEVDLLLFRAPPNCTRCRPSRRYNPYPGLGRCWLGFCAMRVRTARAFRACKTSFPLAA